MYIRWCQFSWKYVRDGKQVARDTFIGDLLVSNTLNPTTDRHDTCKSDVRCKTPTSTKKETMSKFVRNQMVALN